jgi:predicted MFS family arabinose efflux permease
MWLLAKKKGHTIKGSACATAGKDETDNARSLLRDPNLLIIFSVTLIAVMGVSSVTPAFPLIVEHFSLSSQQIGYLVVCFTLPGVFLAPVLGMLADRWGRKRILTVSLFLFALGGSSCFFAASFMHLLILRFAQGIGAAALGSLNSTLIGDIYREPQRTAAMGYNASVLSIGTATYPAIGGALALLGWNFPFLLPLVAVPLAAWMVTQLQNPEPKSQQQITSYFRSVFQTLSRQAAILFLINTFIFIILYGAFLTYLPLLLSDCFQASTLTIGLITAVMSVSTALSSTQVGRLSRCISKRRLIMTGFASYAVSLLLFSVSRGWAGIAFAAILFGAGHGLNIPIIQTLLVGLAPLNYRAAFMSFNGMALRVGQTLGPLLLGLVFVQGNLQAVFIVAALFAVSALLMVRYSLTDPQ